MCVSCLGCLFPFWDLCFCFLVVFFCFRFPILSYVFLFWVYSFPFLLLLLLSCGFFVSISHPIYLIVLCIEIQPLEDTSKLRWKFLHRYQIVQVRNNSFNLEFVQSDISARFILISCCSFFPSRFYLEIINNKFRPVRDREAKYVCSMLSKTSD